MATRVVEGKKPYTGGEAINIDENKVISLKLRDENNLIIYDEGDDEIYVDLQLPDGIEPTDAFPVGVTTGRTVVADGWDKAGTIICAKTTSGDEIKVLYADDGTLWIDNGTGTFKQIYFKSDVDGVIATLTAYINLELAKKQNGVTSATAPSNPSEGDLWYDTTNNVLKVYNGSTWVTTGGGGSGDVAVSTQSDNVLTAPLNLWLGSRSDFNNLTQDSGTLYAIFGSSTPGGWQPGANTIAYYQFEQNLLDSSGNGHDILSGSSYSYVNVGGQYVVEDNGNIDLNIPSGILSGIGTGDFTLSYWMYPIVPVSGESRQPIMFGLTSSTTPYPGPCMFFDYYAYGDPDGGLTNPDAQIIWRTARGTHAVGGDTADYVNGWHHFVMTRISGVVYCYIDNIQVTQYNSNTSIGNTNRGYFVGAAANWSPQGWGTSGAKGDSLILENIGWTSQNVSDYFDQTKATYGIS